MTDHHTPIPDPKMLLETVTMKMPFGKYKGVPLSDLPVSYLEWFQKKGFPAGKLGMLLSTVYEIKLNGLTDIFVRLKRHPVNTFSPPTR